MSVLSAYEVRRAISRHEILIEPFDPKNLANSCYTFALGDRLKRLKPVAEIDARADNDGLLVEEVIPSSGRLIMPGEFVALVTAERLKLDMSVFCLLSTRPALAKLGLDLVQSSILVPSQSDCRLLLETTNRGPVPVRIFPGLKAVKGIFLNVT